MAPGVAERVRNREIEHDMISVLAERAYPSECDPNVHIFMEEDAEGIVEVGVLEISGEYYGFRMSFNKDSRLVIEMDEITEEHSEQKRMVA